jgi:hypothetical protein
MCGWSRMCGWFEPVEEGEPDDVPGHVVCPGEVGELPGRLPVDGHGVVAGVLLEEGFQRRCDVGAVLDQALRAGRPSRTSHGVLSLLRNQS